MCAGLGRAPDDMQARAHIRALSRALTLGFVFTQQPVAVYNLCSERSYEASLLAPSCSVHRFPFDDHNTPSLALMRDCCEHMATHMAADEQNVCAVHCKAGKGRTGTIVCAYLVHSGAFGSAEEAMAFYAEKRTSDGKGVTIPSQRRYVSYYARMALAVPLTPPPRAVLLARAVVVEGPASLSPSVRVMQRRTGSTAMELVAASGDASIEHSFEESRHVFTFRASTFVEGDVRVQVFRGPRADKKAMVGYTWLQTGYEALDSLEAARKSADADVARKVEEGAEVRGMFAVAGKDVDKCDKVRGGGGRARTGSGGGRLCACAHQRVCPRPFIFHAILILVAPNARNAPAQSLRSTLSIEVVYECSWKALDPPGKPWERDSEAIPRALSGSTLAKLPVSPEPTVAPKKEPTSAAPASAPRSGRAVQAEIEMVAARSAVREAPHAQQAPEDDASDVGSSDIDDASIEVDDPETDAQQVDAAGAESLDNDVVGASEVGVALDGDAEAGGSATAQAEAVIAKAESAIADAEAATAGTPSLVAADKGEVNVAETDEGGAEATEANALEAAPGMATVAYHQWDDVSDLPSARAAISALESEAQTMRASCEGAHARARAAEAEAESAVAELRAAAVAAEAAADVARNELAAERERAAGIEAERVRVATALSASEAALTAASEALTKEQGSFVVRHVLSVTVCVRDTARACWRVCADARVCMRRPIWSFHVLTRRAPCVCPVQAPRC